MYAVGHHKAHALEQDERWSDWHDATEACERLGVLSGHTVKVYELTGAIPEHGLSWEEVYAWNPDTGQVSVRFEHDGHRFYARRGVDRRMVTIYVDGEHWRDEGNLFRDVPSDATWIKNAVVNAWESRNA